MKNLFDKIISILGITISLPLLSIVIIINFILYNDDPIFFNQKRVGKNGKMFIIYKFRTMRPNTNQSNSAFDLGNQSRVTKFGKVLRKTKLDELPQLFNVLKGDMSIVGPRPEVLQWTKIYPEKWIEVLKIKPGITDNASIYFRNEEELLATSSNPYNTYKNEILPIKLNYYIEYVNNNSLWGDIVIIFKTIKQIIIK